jgi:hypothetical protein
LIRRRADLAGWVVSLVMSEVTLNLLPPRGTFGYCAWSAASVLLLPSYSIQSSLLLFTFVKSKAPEALPAGQASGPMGWIWILATELGMQTE